VIRVLVLSAGDPAGINFCKSLRLEKEAFYILGADTNQFRVHLAVADERYLLPVADSPDYLEVLRRLIRRVAPDLIYAADTNRELEIVSENRETFSALVYLPPVQAVRVYEDKWECTRRCAAAGVPVPETILVSHPADLDNAFAQFGSVWLRATHGSGGRGSLPTDDIRLARAWIDRHQGWGTFTAAKRLTGRMATWIGIWWEGKLIVGQGRNRLHWEYSHLSPSGVSGITAAQSTTSDPEITTIAHAAIAAAGFAPHGIVGVDLTYDQAGVPNLTEIQASRFYTSIYFLACAGLNMPAMYVRLALKLPVTSYPTGINPLRDDLVWLKTVDAEPILTDLASVHRNATLWRAA
jgi:carbamoyl-phosphate synthase large subunit